jgi:hypothetical protein
VAYAPPPARPHRNGHSLASLAIRRPTPTLGTKQSIEGCHNECTRSKWRALDPMHTTHASNAQKRCDAVRHEELKLEGFAPWLPPVARSWRE